jgi:hypothetical protein
MVLFLRFQTVTKELRSILTSQNANYDQHSQAIPQFTITDIESSTLKDSTDLMRLECPSRIFSEDIKDLNVGLVEANF